MFNLFIKEYYVGGKPYTSSVSIVVLYLKCINFLNYLFQYMTEKIGGVEGTKLDDDFMEMEKVYTYKFFHFSFHLVDVFI